MPIINFTEKELEDYFCEIVNDEFECRLVGRQIKLNCGVLDVLIRDRANGIYHVCELKRECINDAALSQVLAYTAELREIHPFRKFSPLLIGDNISGKHIHHALNRFEASVTPPVASVIIFGYSLDDGVSFHYISKPQVKSQEFRELQFENISYGMHHGKITGAKVGHFVCREKS